MRVTFQNFRNALSPFVCFTALDAQKHFPKFDRKRLSQWQQKGYIRQIIRGHYRFGETAPSLELWWYIANQIFSPSYISLQSALGYYGFIPEGVFQITSITTKRTRELHAERKAFIYRNIKTDNYFGYCLKPWNQHQVKIAEPEKALLDFLYLTTTLNIREDFESMRFNQDMILNTCDAGKMALYAKAMNNQAFLRRFNKFNEWLYD